MTDEEITPETHLLDYYCEGIPRHIEVSKEDMFGAAEGIVHGKLAIYFPIYWNHGEVRKFNQLCGDNFDPGALLVVARKLAGLVLSREPAEVHWIERINLFHLFGLTRIYGLGQRTETFNLLKSVCEVAPQDNGNAFVLVSAINAKSVLENRDPKDENEFFELSSRYPSVITAFGSYQVFYHGGISECIKELHSDIREKGKVPIPSSVLSLLWAADLHFGEDQEIKAKVYDLLYAALPEQTKRVIDQAYRRLKRRAL